MPRPSLKQGWISTPRSAGERDETTLHPLFAGIFKRYFLVAMNNAIHKMLYQFILTHFDLLKKVY